LFFVGELDERIGIGRHGIGERNKESAKRLSKIRRGSGFPPYTHFYDSELI
jgi:hypothetical protein